MRSLKFYLAIVLIYFCLSASSLLAQPTTPNKNLGRVDFPTNCHSDVEADMHAGLALLHHMMYSDSERVFKSVINKDPDCAFAYWGVAMTYLHPLWPDTPSESKMRQALSLLSQARTHAKGDERTLLYIQAAQAYYQEGWNRSESQRLELYKSAWSSVYQALSNDTEAASFYALALMAHQYAKIAQAPSQTKNYSGLEQAGTIAAQVLQKIPDHPAGHHYMIHAYDMEGLASRALKVAHNYGKIAPDVPHALHMPSHIFTRLGLWNDSIAWNLRSAESALQHSGKSVSHHYFHAVDYLTYAYLQKSQDKKADALIENLKKINGSIALSGATAYTLAAAPARIALEKKQWQLAAESPHLRINDFKWEKFPQFEAIIYFTRALGSARSKDLDGANKALARVAQLRSKVRSTYWNYQVEMQEQTIKAWILKLQGNTNEALNTMKKVAEMEAASYKHAITPSDVLPYRELYADLLMELGQYEQAINQYKLSLQRTPNRFNSLYGAAQASSLSGNKPLARKYYRLLLKTIDENSSDRKAVEEARKYLSINV